MKVFGVFLILLGISLGLYVGVWVMFIGGIVQIIEAVRAENLIALDVAMGLARIFFSGIVGWLCGILVVIPGMAFLNS